tara:strand:- start:5047 stop:5337 length:291 start_codon:yes stop_codon:yes gene_type:complete
VSQTGKTTGDMIMDIAMLKAFFGWAAVVNFSIMVLWALLLFGFSQSFFGFFSKLLKGSTELSADTFAHINLQAMALYEIFWYVFSLVPWIVLSFCV